MIIEKEKPKELSQNLNAPKQYLLDGNIPVEIDDDDDDYNIDYPPRYEIITTTPEIDNNLTLDYPLILIVDIDFTLLEATQILTDDQLKIVVYYYILQKEKNPDIDIHLLTIHGKDEKIQKSIININIEFHYQRHIKFRPGVVEMLEELSKYYELYIYSQGLKEYIDEVVKIIDPSQYK